MSKITVVRRCYNCGAVLQTQDPSKEGYVSDSLLRSTPLDKVLFCNRCYNEKKYNLLPKSPVISKDFLTMLKDAKATEALIVYIVDLWSFECSFIPAVSEALIRLPLLVVANKRDLMPANANDEDLKEYVAHRFRVAGLSVKNTDVFLTSLTSQTDLTIVNSEIEKRRKRHDVYVIATEEAGKSLFLDSYLHSYRNQSSRPVQTGFYPGTNLKVISIPLDSSSMVYNTPGMSNENSFVGFNDKKLAFDVVPQAHIEPRKVRLGPSCSLFIGGIARVDLISCQTKEIDVLCYFSSKITLKKVTQKKDMDSFFHKLLLRKSLHPRTHLVTSMKDLDAFEFPIEETGQRDLGIAGLGWISFEGKNEIFRVYVPKGIGVYGSRAKVK